MLANLRARPIAVAFTIAVLAAIFLAATSKASPPLAAAQSLVGSTWPPKPADIVNLDSSSVNSAGIQIAAGAFATVYTVPANRWFIATDIETLSTSGAALQIVQDDGVHQPIKRGNEFTSSGFGAQPFHSSVGIAFAPGTKVELQNASFSSSGTIRYSITGYLAMP